MASLFTFRKDENATGEKKSVIFFSTVQRRGLQTSLALGEPPRGTG